jgi:MurNAc alpha-1-phosphate uridylyltransferase
MILAAGRGERMRPLTDTTPKPLLPVAGKPLIRYHIENLAAAGVRDIVINVAWQAAMIRSVLGDGAQLGVRIHYSEEGDAALETGGGVFRALPLLGSNPFLVLSADIWTDYRLTACISRLAPHDVAHLVLVPNPQFHPRGDFGLDDARVTDAEPRYTYANIGLYRPEFFAACRPGRFALAPLLFDWICKDRISGELHRGRWCNVGTPAQLAELDRELQHQRPV